MEGDFDRFCSRDKSDNEFLTNDDDKTVIYIFFLSYAIAIIFRPWLLITMRNELWNQAFKLIRRHQELVFLFLGAQKVISELFFYLHA